MHGPHLTTLPSVETAHSVASVRRPAPPGRCTVRLAEGRVCFTDSLGRFWRVEERRAPVAPWALGPRFLVFESLSVTRRVWEVPVDWHALDPDALQRLSERR